MVMVVEEELDSEVLQDVNYRDSESLQPQAYIGAKIIKAVPMERDNKPGYKVMYPDGYVSWSPKETFETAYRRITPREKALIQE